MHQLSRNKAVQLADLVDVHRPIYLDVHIPKTAGSERNVILADRFERVCGHKGYSYDAYQTTKRFTESVINVNRSIGEVQDVYWEHYAPYSRHRVPHFVMDEIGYEDCDFISNELPWKFWRDKLPLSLFAQHDIPMEFHIPCRDPIDHLMSQCNHRKRIFNCTADSLEKEVGACVLGMDRFSFQLLEHFQSLEKSLGLKSTFYCFDGMAIDGYVHHMGNRLQPKRLSPVHTHRPFNDERRRDLECIWKMDDAFRQKIWWLLLEKYEYYQFCDSCMKSTNQLVFETV